MGTEPDNERVAQQARGVVADKPISGLLFILDRSTCFEIKYQVSDVPPKKRKTEEDMETEKVEVESTGGGFDAGGG